MKEHLAELEKLAASGDKNINLDAVRCIFLHFQQNMKPSEIANELRIGVRQAQRYIKNFREKGIDSCIKRSVGRKPKEPEKNSLAIKLLGESPREHGYYLNFWTPAMLQNETGLSNKVCNNLSRNFNSNFTLKNFNLIKGDTQLRVKLTELQKGNYNIWWAHYFYIGNDKDLLSQRVRISKDYNGYLLLSLNGHEERLVVREIPRNVPNRPLLRFKQYKAFLEEVCNDLQFNSGKNLRPILMIMNTSTNRNALSVIKIKQPRHDQQMSQPVDTNRLKAKTKSDLEKKKSDGIHPLHLYLISNSPKSPFMLPYNDLIKNLRIELQSRSADNNNAKHLMNFGNKWLHSQRPHRDIIPDL